MKRDYRQEVAERRQRVLDEFERARKVAANAGEDDVAFYLEEAAYKLRQKLVRETGVSS